MLVNPGTDSGKNNPRRLRGSDADSVARRQVARERQKKRVRRSASSETVSRERTMSQQSCQVRPDGAHAQAVIFVVPGPVKTEGDSRSATPAATGPLGSSANAPGPL